MSISNVAMTISFNHPGVVTSPNYPDKYPNDLQNTTTIEVEKGMIIALKFTAFNVEWGDDSCQDNVCQRQGDNLRPPDHRGRRRVHLDGEDKILSETFFWDTL